MKKTNKAAARLRATADIREVGNHLHNETARKAVELTNMAIKLERLGKRMQADAEIIRELASTMSLEKIAKALELSKNYQSIVSK